MTAAVTAREWWAARGRRSRDSVRAFVRDSKKSKTVRIALLLPVVLAGGMIASAAIGFAVTQLSESRIEAERRQALRLAVDELHGAPGDVVRFDDAGLRFIERRAGMVDLQFDAEAPKERGRELQSLHDGRGRIVGWFSWQADRAPVRIMDRLWGALAVLGAVLAACGALAVRGLQQLMRSLERSTRTVLELSCQDELTGLPNHRVMLENLADALAKRRFGVVVFALIDPDGFRDVNDALGRAGGDTVLKAIAEHVRAGLPPAALFGRSEDDEFAVIISSDDPRSASVLTEQLRASLLRPIFVDRMWQIAASIGVAQAPEDGTTSEELARRAGLALRAAKREGRGRVRRFEPQIEADHAERRNLLRELESAISLQDFDVHYQPVVAADGGAIVGVEALLRWTHPTRGPVPPSVFIPLAEQSGLMSQLGEIVLRRALSDGVRWKNLSVAVNLSPLQIRDRWLVDLVGAVMAETGIAAPRVVLEVTEGILVDNPQEAQTRLEALRALGVSIALDDFGTGYSSLSYLQKFPFNQIKIDRAFVASLGASGNAGAIIQSIVTLGHALGMKVVAEGVESDEQRVLLRLAGCDEMQGFLFARPMPAAEIDKALARPVRSAVG
jgi:diguanylate cyclase (GGDEF)-like protein